MCLMPCPKKVSKLPGWLLRLGSLGEYSISASHMKMATEVCHTTMTLRGLIILELRNSGAPTHRWRWQLHMVTLVGKLMLKL